MTRAMRIVVSLGLALSALFLAVPPGAQSACAPGTEQLIIYHAGSLTAAFTQVETLFTQQTGVCITDVSAGSVDLARRITAGQEACDIYASADYEDIDVLVKPAGFADFNILFAQGSMVLAYTTNSKNAASIAAPGSTFNPPAAVPDAATDWYTYLTKVGATVGGSNPFLDPSGYRADLIFQLIERHYGIPNLYDTLLTHYLLTRSTDKLGSTYDYQFIYEHSALAAYKLDPANYRFVKLPDDIGLSDPAENRHYEHASIIIPGVRLPFTEPVVRIPGTRVVWGLTVMNKAPNRANAIKFFQLLFGSQGVALQTASGPAPISPPIVSHRDFRHLPKALQSIVRPDWWER